MASFNRKLLVYQRVPPTTKIGCPAALRQFADVQRSIRDVQGSFEELASRLARSLSLGQGKPPALTKLNPNLHSNIEHPTKKDRTNNKVKSKQQIMVK
jgi:hypothetical protein